ncbi:MAG TPA: exodeoxyribonuclease VII large subunit, partial [Bacteroidetes bacterium]|nr:exodeoxyribonuclease VII large subunit [Bacteroidota bacterium]
RLESDGRLQDVHVMGEVSNLVRHSSGHCYFTLKDAQAQLSCAMFRNVAVRYQDAMPRHGEQVVLRGEISLYPPRGSYQLIVRALAKAGQGDLHQKFIALRDRLKAEGLFEVVHKQKLPKFPRRIGIITSPTGAVIRDIVDTVRRRYPHLGLLLVPTKVQGEGAAESLVGALEKLQAVPGIDVILLARGGGSLEDLWCFNEEVVARAIYACSIPVISGVGHETDVTIADYVADKRAATPTAAAELAVPVAAEILAWLDDAVGQLRRNLRHFIENRQQLLDDYTFRLESRMLSLIAFQRQMLDGQEQALERNLEADFADRRRLLQELGEGLERAMSHSLEKTRHDLAMLEVQLLALDARKVLERGYSVSEVNGKRISQARQIKVGDTLTTHFHEGKAHSKVNKIQEKNE